MSGLVNWFGWRWALCAFGALAVVTVRLLSRGCWGPLDCRFVRDPSTAGMGCGESWGAIIYLHVFRSSSETSGSSASATVRLGLHTLRESEHQREKALSKSLSGLEGKGLGWTRRFKDLIKNCFSALTENLFIWELHNPGLEMWLERLFP